MKRDTVMNGIGLTLLACCFLWAATRIIGRARQDRDPDRIVIRFAHWQLENGIRIAFDRLAKNYMEMHPGVVVEQMLVPERVYPNWLITQLIGGTAPDLIEMRAMPDDRMARYFLPLMDFVNEPNPYNVGTPLEGMPLRDTFLDGMSSSPSYVPTLFDFYAIPTSMFTIRLYYNVPLYRKIRGDKPVPRNYDEFIELCEEVEAYAQRTQITTIPIAGSQYNSPMVMFTLLSSQTQQVGIDWSSDYRLIMNNENIFLSFMDGTWDYTHPALQSAFTLMRSIGKYMQPGFLSLRRDDATLYFVQSRALMIASGSWDVMSMHSQAPFEIDAFAIPLPRKDDPVYGPHTLGVLTEAGQPTGAAFGVTRQSKHPDVALDFMRYVVSVAGNQLFSDISYWLPAVVGVELPDKVKPFDLITEGYVSGFRPFMGADTRRVFDNHLHLLVGPGGSVEAFSSAMQEKIPAAVIQDMRISQNGRNRQFHRMDSLLAALAQMTDEPGTDDPEHHRLNELIESTVDLEASMYWIQHEFDRLGERLTF